VRPDKVIKVKIVAILQKPVKTGSDELSLQESVVIDRKQACGLGLRENRAVCKAWARPSVVNLTMLEFAVV
jgi:hypothetical protein